jgi:transcriptional regulator with XRE-family HTH domain
MTKQQLINIPVFSERLRRIRKEKLVNQIELAAFLSVAQNTVSNWEIGRAQPDIDTIVKISDFFEISTDYLLGVSDKQEEIALRRNI